MPAPPSLGPQSPCRVKCVRFDPTAMADKVGHETFAPL